MFQIIPVDQVHPARDNVRRRLGDTRDLLASITSVGIVEPLLVTPRPEDGGGGYTVVAGHRRLAAARAAGLVEVPCTIRTLSDLERVEIMVAENLARSGLSVMDEAGGYFRMAEFGLTTKDLAKRLGRLAAHIKARLALLELPKAAQLKLDNGAWASARPPRCSPSRTIPTPSPGSWPTITVILGTGGTWSGR